MGQLSFSYDIDAEAWHDTLPDIESVCERARETLASLDKLHS